MISVDMHYLNLSEKSRKAQKDPEMKLIIQKHYATHVKNYNIKVEYLSKTNDSTMKLQVPELTDTMQSYTQSNIGVSSVTPRENIQQFNDREMATEYLLILKGAGREYVWSAMEASNPGVRLLGEYIYHIFPSCF